MILRKKIVVYRDVRFCEDIFPFRKMNTDPNRVDPLDFLNIAAHYDGPNEEESTLIQLRSNTNKMMSQILPLWITQQVKLMAQMSKTTQVNRILVNLSPINLEENEIELNQLTFKTSLSRSLPRQTIFTPHQINPPQLYTP